jgi:hypothetical protein
MRNSNDRMPKADYFRMRLADATANGLTAKADYYTSRLAQMSEPIEISSIGKTDKVTFANGLVVFAL